MEREQLEAELAELLEQLIAIPSTYPPGDISDIALFCSRYLEGLGYRCAIHENKPGVKNLLASKTSSPPVVFTAHLDTVGPGDLAAWESDPFAARKAGKEVYGLGACNCKASVAVQLWLAKQLAKQKATSEIGFAFVGDEENLGPDGLAYLREAGFLRPRVLIVGAPTGNALVLEERGVMWVRIATRGQAAHAGAPELGESAILKMHAVIAALRDQLGPVLQSRRTEDGQQATISIGRISGGSNINVVPDKCLLELDRRLLPYETVEGAFAEIKAAALAGGANEVQLLTGTPGFRTTGDIATAMKQSIAAVSGNPARVVNALGASDGRHFAGDGIEIVVYGPGQAEVSHKANERVSLAEMAEAALVQLHFVSELRCE